MMEAQSSGIVLSELLWQCPQVILSKLKSHMAVGSGAVSVDGIGSWVIIYICDGISLRVY